MAWSKNLLALDSNTHRAFLNRENLCLINKESCFYARAIPAGARWPKGGQGTFPYFPAKARVLHKGFDDPPRLAENAKDKEEAMGHYRRVRDEIKAFVERLPGALHRACPL